MQFNEKQAAALRFLESKGISRTHYAPVVYRWLWRVGVQVPPPHFAGFFFNWAVLGSVFFLACYATSFVGMWLTGVSEESSVLAHLPYLTAYGLLFGLVMSLTYRIGAWKHTIPSWKEFNPSIQPSQAKATQ